jgi:hypothetical protein
MQGQVIQLLSLLIPAVGFVAVFISLYLTRKQTEEMTTQSRSIAESVRYTTFQNIIAETTSFDQQFINHPEIRPYFFGGMDIEEADPHYNLALSFADYVLDYFDFLLIQSRQFPQVFPSQTWGAFIADVFATSPLLRRYLASGSIRTWYSSDLLTLMRKQLEAVRDSTSTG